MRVSKKEKLRRMRSPRLCEMSLKPFFVLYLVDGSGGYMWICPPPPPSAGDETVDEDIRAAEELGDSTGAGAEGVAISWGIGNTRQFPI